MMMELSLVAHRPHYVLQRGDTTACESAAPDMVQEEVQELQLRSDLITLELRPPLVENIDQPIHLLARLNHLGVTQERC